MLYISLKPNIANNAFKKKKLTVMEMSEVLQQLLLTYSSYLLIFLILTTFKLL